MKRACALLAIVLVLSMVVPNPAWAGGGHHHHGGWWWPGAVIGGLALGAVALATAPFWAFAPPPQPAPVVYAPPAYTTAAAYPVPPQESAPPLVQREVVYANGRYILYGDGVRQPWQWVWYPAAPPPPPMAR
jgi:hypothetical protein